MLKCIPCMFPKKIMPPCLQAQLQLYSYQIVSFLCYSLGIHSLLCCKSTERYWISFVYRRAPSWHLRLGMQRKHIFHFVVCHDGKLRKTKLWFTLLPFLSRNGMNRNSYFWKQYFFSVVMENYLAQYSIITFQSWSPLDNKTLLTKNYELLFK